MRPKKKPLLMGALAEPRYPIVFNPSPRLESLPDGITDQSFAIVGLRPNPRGSHALAPAGPQAVEVANG